MLNNNINYNAAPVPMATTVPVQGMPQPYAPQPTPYPQGMPSYAPDQASFSPYGAAPRPQQPAVQVGLMDKMKSYFNDTYNTEDNLRAYKIFQQEVDNNPQTLKPGSQDKGRVEELQRRLNIVGISANVNGIYGYATGEAIKEFKTKMGINDGFLNKEGKPAITDIATPQMQAVLNYAVTRQLNPGMPGPNNPMPLTQEDMVWAQNLMARVQQFGYKPTQQEYSRYQDILARQQTSGTPQMPQTQVPANPIVMQPPVQQPVFQPPAQTSLPLASGPVNQQELQWALDLQTRITNQGYQPSAQEAAQYDNIQKRYAAQQAPASQPTAPANSGQPVTQQELDWALDLQNRITTQGYQPTQQEADAYTDIFNRYQNQPAQPTAPSAPTRPAPGTTAPVRIDNSVSSQELQWAMDLQHRIDTQGYRPTQQDIIRYTDIYNRYQASQQEAANKPPVVAPQPSQPSAPPVVTQPSQPAPTQPAAPQPSPGGNSTHPNAVAYQDVQWRSIATATSKCGFRCLGSKLPRQPPSLRPSKALVSPSRKSIGPCNCNTKCSSKVMLPANRKWPLIRISTVATSNRQRLNKRQQPNSPQPRSQPLRPHNSPLRFRSMSVAPKVPSTHPPSKSLTGPCVYKP
jgi:hypothetical protein